LYRFLVFVLAVAMVLPPFSEARDFSVERFYFPGYDGADISAMLYVPSEGSAHPAIILYHGVTATKETMIEFAENFAENGFVVLAYDHRSHGESTGDFTWEGMLEDSLTALDIVRGRDDVDSDRVSLMGHSMGGMIAIMTAAVDGNIRAVVDLAAPETVNSFLLWVLRPLKGEFEPSESDVIDAMNTAYGDVYGEHIETTRGFEPVRVGGLHTTVRELMGIWAGSQLPRYKPLKQVEDVEDILLLHGTEDNIVNPRDSEDMFDRAEKEKDIFYIDGATHMSYLRYLGVKRDGSLWDNKNYDEEHARAVKDNALEWVERFM
jgi:alpha-beta hydrolase superfamily lysophospholipase